jgi:nitroreductase
MHTPAAQTAALQALLNRHSLGPRWMVAPGPSDEQLTLAVRAALRAPDHGRLQPWRAITIGTAQRAALADLFEQFARESGKSEEEVAAERERAYNGPVLLAWVARIDPTVDKVPAHEQWLCVGGALANFMNAVHLMGYGAKILSGRKCQHPALVRAFCEESEQLVGFICIGTPTREPAPRDKDEVGPRLSAWRVAR